MNLLQTSEVGGFGKQEQDVESFPSVDRSLLRGTRDREFGGVSLSPHLRGKIFSNTSKRKQNELLTAQLGKEKC